MSCSKAGAVTGSIDNPIRLHPHAGFSAIQGNEHMQDRVVAGRLCSVLG
jgi:hypothetical protein